MKLFSFTLFFLFLFNCISQTISNSILIPLKFDDQNGNNFVLSNDSDDCFFIKNNIEIEYYDNYKIVSKYKIKNIEEFKGKYVKITNGVYNKNGVFLIVYVQLDNSKRTKEFYLINLDTDCKLKNKPILIKSAKYKNDFDYYAGRVEVSEIYKSKNNLFAFQIDISVNGTSSPSTVVTVDENSNLDYFNTNAMSLFHDLKCIDNSGNVYLTELEHNSTEEKFKIKLSSYKKGEKKDITFLDIELENFNSFSFSNINCFIKDDFLYCSYFYDYNNKYVSINKVKLMEIRISDASINYTKEYNFKNSEIEIDNFFTKEEIENNSFKENLLPKEGVGFYNKFTGFEFNSKGEVLLKFEEKKLFCTNSNIKINKPNEKPRYESFEKLIVLKFSESKNECFQFFLRENAIDFRFGNFESRCRNTTFKSFKNDDDLLCFYFTDVSKKYSKSGLHSNEFNLNANEYKKKCIININLDMKTNEIDNTKILYDESFNPHLYSDASYFNITNNEIVLINRRNKKDYFDVVKI